jgi:hypothetical protein
MSCDHGAIKLSAHGATPSVTCSNFLNQPNEYPLTSTTAPDDAKVQSVVSSIPAGLPSAACCTAAKKVTRAAHSATPVAVGRMDSCACGGSVNTDVHLHSIAPPCLCSLTLLDAGARCLSPRRCRLLVPRALLWAWPAVSAEYAKRCLGVEGLEHARCAAIDTSVCCCGIIHSPCPAVSKIAATACKYTPYTC